MCEVSSEKRHRKDRHEMFIVGKDKDLYYSWLFYLKMADLVADVHLLYL